MKEVGGGVSNRLNKFVLFDNERRNTMSKSLKPLFFQEDNSAVYVKLDGTLRHVPNVPTFENLFPGGIDPNNYTRFANIDCAPYPIGRPLMDGARLVGNPAGICLTDVMPWEPDKVVLRHVINPEQMNDCGFDWEKVVYYDGPLFIGVPLATDSDENMKVAEELAGLYALYAHIIFEAPMNPYFEPLLVFYPDYRKQDYMHFLMEQFDVARQKYSALTGIKF